MIERGEDLCFAFETRDPFRIFCKRLWQDLHGHTPSKPYIPGLIHLAHSARAQAALDFVLPEFVADHLEAILVQEPAKRSMIHSPRSIEHGLWIMDHLKGLHLNHSDFRNAIGCLAAVVSDT